MAISSRRNLDLDWLEDFLEVAKTGSFTRAAETRGVTQSALSRRILNLELWVGREGVLLDRSSYPIRLTRPGQLFQKYANDVVKALQDARGEALSIDPVEERVQIFTLHTLAATFVPLFIRAVRKRMYDDQFQVKTSVKVGHIPEGVEAISYGSIPFMVCYETANFRIVFPSDMPQDRIAAVTLARDRLIPVCSKKNYSKYQELIKSQHALLPYSNYTKGTYLAQIVDEKTAELERKMKGVKFSLVDEAQMADTLRNLAREGQGIAWVLHSTAERALKNELRSLQFEAVQSHIDLEIKLFWALDYTSPTIERIWKMASTLEGELSAPSLNSLVEDE